MNLELPRPVQPIDDIARVPGAQGGSPDTAFEVSPLTLAKLPLNDAEVVLHNRLHLRRHLWQGEVMGQALTVRWAADQAGGASAEGSLQLLCALGDARLSLALPLAIARQLDASLIGPIDLASSLLIEHAWLPLVESLETLFQQPLRILPSTAFGGTLQLALSLQLNDQPALPASLRMDAASAALLLDALDRYCPAVSLGFASLPLTAQLCAGDAPLTVAEWQSLQAGDVVMLDQPADALPGLLVGGRLQAPVQADGNRLRLSQPFTPAPFPMNRNHPMSTTDALDEGLDSLPLTLICQLGSYELSLAQLREMGPGSVLPLTTDSERVELMINGHRVGQGELVRIGSGLGVRLLSLTHP